MGYLQDFLLSQSGNECPRDYVLMAAYTTLSVAIGHRVYFDMEFFHIRANLYSVLVGPSGNRKTFARDQANNILHEALPDVIVSAEQETRQGITKFMAADSQARFYVNGTGERIEYHRYGLFAGELRNYLALDPTGMVTFLTEIYDKKGYRYRLKNEDHTLIHPYFVILACTVPGWFSSQIRSDIFCEGFGRRSIFVCNDDDIREPELRRSPEAQAAWSRCVEHLRVIQGNVGVFTFDAEAREFYNAWYRSVKLPDDVFLRAWARSKHIQLIKLAMLTALSEGTGFVIPKRYLELGLATLQSFEDKFGMITMRMGRSDVMEPLMTMLDVVRNHGGQIPEKELKLVTMKNFKSSLEQWQILKHLQETDQIVIGVQKVNGVERRMVALPENVVRKSVSDASAAQSTPSPQPHSSGDSPTVGSPPAVPHPSPPLSTET